MSLTNCKECGKPHIQAAYTEYCAECKVNQDQIYRTFREFVKNNPRSTVYDVHQQTGIPLSKVLRLQKDGYVSYS